MSVIKSNRLVGWWKNLHHRFFFVSFPANKLRMKPLEEPACARVWKVKKASERTIARTKIDWENVMSILQPGFWYDYKDVLMPVHQLQCQTMLLFRSLLNFVFIMHACKVLHLHCVCAGLLFWVNDALQIVLQAENYPKPSIIHTEWIALEPITITFAIIVCLLASFFAAAAALSVRASM